MKKDFIKIGKITTSHGIKGEVKVLPYNDEIDNISSFPKLFISYNNSIIEVHVNSIKHIKQFTILGFKEYSNINDILKFKDCELLIDFDDATPLNDGQYYLEDLININVYDENNNSIGFVSDILETNANNVFEITKNDKSTLLVPDIDDCILKIDIENKIMIVHLLEGL